jgi:23S rRNA (uracil1939-C5)-methyltransferase
VKSFPIVEVTLDKIVGGGQALGTLPDGRKLFVWGGLPGETVTVQITKKRSKLAEGKVTEVITPSDMRITPHDATSYLSTSPWQIMTPEAEAHYKAALIEEAFELHDVVLPDPIEVKTDGNRFGYRNKMEFSFYWDVELAQLELAFFVRASKGKVPVDGSALARGEINDLARAIRDLLRTKPVEGRSLKTLMIRSNQAGECVWQLYMKDDLPELISQQEAGNLPAIGGHLIYSDPKSPASKITKVLASFGQTTLQDSVRDIPFSYSADGFFQVNLPLYEMALDDMSAWLSDRPTIDMYSGIGTIGLTIGNKDDTTLIELDDSAVKSMRSNIEALTRNAKAVHASSETALEYISSNTDIIVDPPRAGLHPDVVRRLLDVGPSRIVYLSCNPVTQARDVAMLAERYGIRSHTGYNFFPATPHIEHLVVLDLKA